LGEVSHKGEVNFEQVARKATKEIGFTSDEVGLDCNNCNVIVNVEAQSPEIFDSVHGGTKTDKELGAGD
jgi:S-adenosylmethionine synthetase